MLRTQVLATLRPEAQYAILDVPLDRCWNHVPEGGQAIHERRQRRILTKRGDLALKGCGRRDLLSKQLGRSLALSERLRRSLARTTELFLESRDRCGHLFTAAARCIGGASLRSDLGSRRLQFVVQERNAFHRLLGIQPTEAGGV